MAKKIRVKVFDDLRQSLADAGAYEHGKPVNLRTQEIPPPELLTVLPVLRAIRQFRIVAPGVGTDSMSMFSPP